MPELHHKVMTAAKAAEMQAGVDATLRYKGKPFSAGKIIDARVRAAVVAVLRELAADDYGALCERVDGLYALAVSLHELADRIEDEQAVNGG